MDLVCFVTFEQCWQPDFYVLAVTKRLKTAELLDAVNSQESEDDSDFNFSDILKGDEEELDGEEEDNSEDDDKESEDEENDDEVRRNIISWKSFNELLDVCKICT